MKFSYSCEVKRDENSYQIRDFENFIDKNNFMAGDSTQQVTLLTTMNEKFIWILFSDGNLYEYDSFAKKLLFAKICYYVI